MRKFEYAKNVYVVFGMKRSGHHAIMDWIRYSFNEPTVFFNDCNNPDVTDVEDGDEQFGKSPLDVAYNFWLNDVFYRTPAKTIQGVHGEPNCLMWSYENFDLEKYNHTKLRKMVDKTVEKYENLYLIVVTRDPFNHMASMYKGSNKTQFLDLDMWKKYAQADDYVPNIITIDYTRWMTDLEYKKSIFEIVDGDTFRAEVRKINPHGGGSSFDREARLVEEIRDKVTKRWKHDIGTERMDSIIKDGELMELVYEIYDHKFVNSIIEAHEKNG